MGLNGRVARLEELTIQPRIARLARELGQPVEAIKQEWADAASQLRCLRAAGYEGERLVQRLADDNGLDVGELRRELDRLDP